MLAVLSSAASFIAACTVAFRMGRARPWVAIAALFGAVVGGATYLVAQSNPFVAADRPPVTDGLIAAVRDTFGSAAMMLTMVLAFVGVRRSSERSAQLHA